MAPPSAHSRKRSTLSSIFFKAASKRHLVAAAAAFIVAFSSDIVNSRLNRLLVTGNLLDDIAAAIGNRNLLAGNHGVLPPRPYQDRVDNGMRKPLKWPEFPLYDCSVSGTSNATVSGEWAFRPRVANESRVLCSMQQVYTGPARAQVPRPPNLYPRVISQKLFPNSSVIASRTVGVTLTASTATTNVFHSHYLIHNSPTAHLLSPGAALFINNEVSLPKHYHPRATSLWAFNGVSPGPTIWATVGDILQIDFHNKLPASTFFYIDGQFNALEALEGGIVHPGKTETITIPLSTAGTFLYHSPIDAPYQVALGLFGTLVVSDAAATESMSAASFKPRRPKFAADGDVLVLSDMVLHPDTMNHVFPGNDPVARANELYNGRVGNVLLLNGYSTSAGHRLDLDRTRRIHHLRVVNVASATFQQIRVPGVTLISRSHWAGPELFNQTMANQALILPPGATADVFFSLQGVPSSQTELQLLVSDVTSLDSRGHVIEPKIESPAIDGNLGEAIDPQSLIVSEAVLSESTSAHNTRLVEVLLVPAEDGVVTASSGFVAAQLASKHIMSDSQLRVSNHGGESARFESAISLDNCSSNSGSTKCPLVAWRFDLLSTIPWDAKFTEASVLFSLVCKPSSYPPRRIDIRLLCVDLDNVAPNVRVSQREPQGLNATTVLHAKPTQLAHVAVGCAATAAVPVDVRGEEIAKYLSHVHRIGAPAWVWLKFATGAGDDSGLLVASRNSHRIAPPALRLVYETKSQSGKAFHQTGRAGASAAELQLRALRLQQILKELSLEHHALGEQLRLLYSGIQQKRLIAGRTAPPLSGAPEERVGRNLQALDSTAQRSGIGDESWSEQVVSPDERLPLRKIPAKTNLVHRRYDADTVDQSVDVVDPSPNIEPQNEGTNSSNNLPLTAAQAESEAALKLSRNIWMYIRHQARTLSTQHQLEGLLGANNSLSSEYKQYLVKLLQQKLHDQLSQQRDLQNNIRQSMLRFGVLRQNNLDKHGGMILHELHSSKTTPRFRGVARPEASSLTQNLALQQYRNQYLALYKHYERLAGELKQKQSIMQALQNDYADLKLHEILDTNHTHTPRFTSPLKFGRINEKSRPGYYRQAEERVLLVFRLTQPSRESSARRSVPETPVATDLPNVVGFRGKSARNLADLIEPRDSGTPQEWRLKPTAHMWSAHAGDLRLPVVSISLGQSESADVLGHVPMWMITNVHYPNRTRTKALLPGGLVVWQIRNPTTHLYNLYFHRLVLDIFEYELSDTDGGQNAIINKISTENFAHEGLIGLSIPPADGSARQSIVRGISRIPVIKVDGSAGPLHHEVGQHGAGETGSFLTAGDHSTTSFQWTVKVTSSNRQHASNGMTARLHFEVLPVEASVAAHGAKMDLIRRMETLPSGIDFHAFDAPIDDDFAPRRSTMVLAAAASLAGLLGVSAATGFYKKIGNKLGKIVKPSSRAVGALAPVETSSTVLLGYNDSAHGLFPATNDSPSTSGGFLDVAVAGYSTVKPIRTCTTGNASSRAAEVSPLPSSLLVYPMANSRSERLIPDVKSQHPFSTTCASAKPSNSPAPLTTSYFYSPDRAKVLKQRASGTSPERDPSISTMASTVTGSSPPLRTSVSGHLPTINFSSNDSQTRNVATAVEAQPPCQTGSRASTIHRPSHRSNHID